MVHPIQTDAVDYLTQRSELMMGLFYLLTLYCAIRALGSDSPDRWHAAAVVSCLLGAGCKESIVTAPVIVVLYDRMFVFDSMKDALRARTGLYIGLWLSWVELAAVATSRNKTVGFSSGVSAWTYLLNQTQMISQYLKLTIWPHALVIDYGVPRPYGLMDVLPQALLVVTLLIVTGIALVRSPMAGFLGAWFFITLAPTSSFIPIVSEVGAERRCEDSYRRRERTDSAHADGHEDRWHQSRQLGPARRADKGSPPAHQSRLRSRGSQRR